MLGAVENLHDGSEREVQTQPVTALVPAEYLLAGLTFAWKSDTNIGRSFAVNLWNGMPLAGFQALSVSLF